MRVGGRFDAVARPVAVLGVQALQRGRPRRAVHQHRRDAPRKRREQVVQQHGTRTLRQLAVAV